MDFQRKLFCSFLFSYWYCVQHILK